MANISEKDTKAQTAHKQTKQVARKVYEAKARLTVNLDDAWDDLIDALIDVDENPEFKYGLFEKTKPIQGGWSPAPYSDLSEEAQMMIQPTTLGSHGDVIIDGDSILLRIPIELYKARQTKYVRESYLNMEDMVHREIVHGRDAGGTLKMDGDKDPEFSK